MSSSEGKSTDTHGFSEPVLYTTIADGEQSLDSEQIFNLLSSLLPLEICLHYQVLPLELEHQRLVLGMVYPEDNDALEYVNRIVSYLNCTIDIRAIAVHTHQEILSAYLRYQNTTTDNCQIQQAKISEETEYPSIFIDTEEELREIKPGLIVDLEEDLEPIQTDNKSELGSEVDMAPVSPIMTENPAIATPGTKVETETTQLQGDTTVLQSAKLDKAREKLPKNLPVLPPLQKLRPIDVLPTLPCKQLLAELLGRVLTSGIGRLYLERQPYEGKIIWSHNGVQQSVLEKLPLSTYQGLLNELKRFASLSLTKVEAPKHVEKEYLYQNNRLLLRLRVMPGKYGEEATLQVLKGAALQFYHQRQIERLSNDSLRITQHLSRKLHQLQEQLILKNNSNSEKLTALHKLDQLMDNLDYQIKILSIPSEG